MNYITHCIARIAVPFFFVSSGFFLFRKSSISDFTFENSKKYILRIARLYIVWTLLYTPRIIGEIVNSQFGILYGCLDFVRRFFLTGKIGTHLWYLHSLIVAVFIVSVLLHFKTKKEFILLLAIGMYIIGLFSQPWISFIEPLQSRFPLLWQIMKSVFCVVGSTPNGFFEGFLFVTIGMFLAHCKIMATAWQSLVAFIISMFLMIGEFILLNRINGTTTPYDVCIMLVPTVSFLFYFAKSLNIRNNSRYKTLRIVSSLVYYSHIWVRGMIHIGVNLIDEELSRTCIMFLLTVVSSLLFSYIIYKLSLKKRYSWLKWLYV